MTKTKIFIIILLLAVAACAVEIYYEHQPTDDLGPISVHHETRSPAPDSSATTPSTIQPQADISGWTTYTNSQYGFSFNYPSLWSVNDCGSTDVVYLKLGGDIPCGSDIPTDASIGIYKGQDPNVLVSSYDLYLQNIVRSKIVVDGVSADKIVGNPKQTQDSMGTFNSSDVITYIVLKKDGNVIDISFRVASSDANSNSGFQSLILPTFKFTK